MVQAHRNHFPVTLLESEIQELVTDLLDTKLSDDEISQKYSIENNRDWKLQKARESLRNLSDPFKAVMNCS